MQILLPNGFQSNKYLQRYDMLELAGKRQYIQYAFLHNIVWKICLVTNTVWIDNFIFTIRINRVCLSVQLVMNTITFVDFNLKNAFRSILSTGKEMKKFLFEFYCIYAYKCNLYQSEEISSG